MTNVHFRLGLACLALLTIAARGAGAPRDALAPTPTLHAPATADLEREFSAWLTARGIESPKREQALAALPSAAMREVGELLTPLAAACAVIEPRAATLLLQCSQPRGTTKLPDTTWLTTDEFPPLVRNNLRLLYGRWLAQQRLFDEALAQLDGLNPQEVAEPATLLFYQAVVNHRLLNRDPGMKAIDRLLGEVIAPPQRYKTVATLMRADLAALEDDTLDHIARRMDDIGRRLDLGRGGSRTRQIEDGVIKSLDKLIEDMEKQQQQQQQSSSSSPSGASQPMQQAQLPPAKGPGKTDRRNIGNSSGWGDLPPKEREEALQQIGKDLPAHYRDVIEQYFRKLAAEGGDRK